MKTMACWTCALKHISLASSFAKEVCNGHGLGSELDHRNDMMGEIENAEIHLITLGAELPFQLINGLRKKLEASRYIIEEGELHIFNRVFAIIEKLMFEENGIVKTPYVNTAITIKPCKTCGGGQPVPVVIISLDKTESEQKALNEGV